MMQDVQFALRTLRNSPGFAIAAICTLALGIGANTAIFSVVDAVLLRPLPFPDPDRLVLLTESNIERNVVKTGVPYPDYVAWTNQSRVLEQIGAYWNVAGSDGFVLRGTNFPERVRGTIATRSFFAVLGVQPAIGRGFLPGEEKAGGGNVFLISDGLWRRGFGASRDAIGKTFQLEGKNSTLIGVLPAGFQFPEQCEVWTPFGTLTDRQLNDRVSHPNWVLARLRPGVTLRQAKAEMNGIEHRLGQAYPDTTMNWRVNVTPLLDEFVGNIRVSLLVLFSAVVFILLIACANVANLLLARAVAREKEFALRMALGAGRMRLLRQTLTESLIIVAISTALALLLAKLTLRLILILSTGTLQRMHGFDLNGPVLAFAAGLTLLVTLLTGIAPALQGSALNFQESLREGQRSGLTGIRNLGLRRTLVIAEVAIALLLLCGAGLMLKSFARLHRVSPGFVPGNLVTMKIALPETQYAKPEQRAIFVTRLLQRIQALPGAKAAGITTTLPLSGDKNWATVNVVGRPILDWAHAPSVEFRTISAAYFRTMGVPLLRGRSFRENDAQEASRSVIVNEAMAGEFWPGIDPIGQRLIVNQQSGSREVIGVVGNIKDFGLDAEDDPCVYVPYGNQYWPSTMNLVVRSASEPKSLISASRSQVAALDMEVPVYQVTTMNELLTQSMAPHRFLLFLLALFAALALILASVGIYGLLAFEVSRRRHEIGLRVALGAEWQEILRLIVWQGMRLVLVGLLIGGVASFALTRLMGSLLYRVSPADPLTFAGVALVFTAVAMCACAIPVLRTLRVDPLTALRCG